MKHTIFKQALYIVLVSLFACNEVMSPNAEMATLLSAVAKSEYNAQNGFCPEAQLAFFDSILTKTADYNRITSAWYCKASSFLQLGDEQQSATVLEDVLKRTNPADIAHIKMVQADLAIAYLRIGERKNCIHNHGAQSCVFPIQGTGIHSDKTGSAKAIEIYEMLLKDDPYDLESRWLLNIAYMTIGEYPQSVPAAYLIKGLGEDTFHLVKPFIDAAVNIGLNTNNMAGGSIVDDFNNDGYLDIITSSWSLDEGMHYCRNNSNGSFKDVSDSSGLSSLTGGLNIMQTDYNNDGFKDIFVLRGHGKESLAKSPIPYCAIMVTVLLQMLPKKAACFLFILHKLLPGMILITTDGLMFL